MSRSLDNWIQAYLVYTAESESPEEFHRWTAINVIASALQRKTFFPMGYFIHYPNQFIVLVSPAGRCKKSTSMRIGQGILQNIPTVVFTVDSTTRERLILDMSQAFKDGHSSMTAYSSEFASLLTSSGMDMVVFMTDIYDSPTSWSHKTKIGGTNTIKAPCLNLEACTTPDWLAKAMPLDTIGVGLTSRIIFIYQDTPRKRSARPILSKEQHAIRDLLISDLQQIAMITGEYHMDDLTFRFYDDWYQSRVENPNPTGDPRLNGYFERKPGHVLKLAMVVAAAQRNELVLTIQDVKTALDILEHTEVLMPKVFANVGKNPLSADVDDVVGAVKLAGGLSLGEVAMRFKHSMRLTEVKEVLDTLIASGQVILRGMPLKYYATGETPKQSVVHLE